MNATSTGSTPSAADSEVAEASAPISGGPATNPTQPQADTVAIAAPGLRPGSRPAALLTVGTTRARPIPRKANPAMAVTAWPPTSPAVNPAAATAARTGSADWTRNRASTRLPDSRTMTMVRANAV